MKKNDEKIDVCGELRELIQSVSREELLPALKDKFRNAAVGDRSAYKQELLKLAQEPDVEPFHVPIFETLASLNAIWEEYIPRKGLVKKFQALYEAEKFEEAGRVYSELISQGLDYVDTIDIGPGTLLPLVDKKAPKLLQFSEWAIRILDLDLNLINQLNIPLTKQILDVLVPVIDPSDPDVMKKNKTGNRIWALLEDKTSLDREIIPLSEDQKKLEQELKIEVPKELAGFNRLSRFQGYLMLVGDRSIRYYHQDQGWVQWLTTEAAITCFREIGKYYWFGLADGHVRIVEKVEQGVKNAIGPFYSSVRSIGSFKKVVATAAEKKLLRANMEGKSTSEFLKNDSPIRRMLILNENVMVLLQDNGRLLGRDMRHGDILWQINLGEQYDSLVNIENRVYCKKEEGPVKLLFLPDIRELENLLKKQGVTVVEGELERDPSAPVHDPVDFHNRADILEKIKNNPGTIFFVTGAPKSGKTSLLYVLEEVLTADSRFCYIDIKEVNKEISSYNEFETKFYTQCLLQHGIPAEDRRELLAFQKLSVIVNKIRGNKPYCVFGLDNFVKPDFGNALGNGKFDQFIRELCVHKHVRLVITCLRRKQKENQQYFREIHSAASKDKKSSHIDLLPFSEDARLAIRKVGNFSEQQVGEIYGYTGGFPHLIQLYYGWNPGKTDIETYSNGIAQDDKDKIFAYFRDLNPNACLILATLLFKSLTSKKVNIDKIYGSSPLLAKFVSRDNFKPTMKEISDYGKEFKVVYTDDRFEFEIEGKPGLFYQAAQNIPWVKMLFALYRFSSNPDIKNAHRLVLSYRNLINIKIEDEDKTPESSTKSKYSIKKLIERYKDQFYIREMSKEAREALKIPLTTYILITLKPWNKGKTINDFSSLYASLQEYLRRAQKSAGSAGAAARFYILLFSFGDISFADLEQDLAGFDRISIIDSLKAKEMLLAGSPLEKTRDIIFQQLKISDRSPYIHAGPVEDIFFGRDIEIALVRGLPENIGIFGTRTIGKTSLMLKIYRDLKDVGGWKVFAVDCGRIDSEKKLLTKLSELMEIPIRSISNIRKFKKYITMMAEEGEIKFLLLLDEVDALVQYDVKHREKIFKTFNILRTEPLKHGGTAARFVLFGFAEMFSQMKNPNSRLYNFMVFLPLQALNSESALELVTRPMDNILVKWENMKDAEYLVDQCSCHPWLLQAACHTLLKVLDKDSKKFDIVERRNVDQALLHDDFRQLCLRPYESISRLDKEPVLPGIHKITTLAASLLHLEKGIEQFTLNDIREELVGYGIDVSPDRMQTIIANLCMYGIFKYLGDTDILMKEETNRGKEIREGIQDAKGMMKEKVEEIGVNQPGIFDTQKGITLEFKYQFAVKIFPKILAANLGGLENCRKEIEEAVKRKKKK
ncbi:MAG: hypothetical protein KAW12_24685 [Candidatus Aminicenantes bacterium]|nr:hypothetical protein [Candidatus Aminicenantes bacterium]